MTFKKKTDFFKPGTPSVGRVPGIKNGPSKKNAREMIASFIDGNSDRLNGWLDEIYQTDGALAAFKAFSDLLEYHVPKLSRIEHTGKDEGPVELVISWDMGPDPIDEGLVDSKRLPSP